MQTKIDKQQLFEVLTAQLNTKLESELKQAQMLMGQSSEENKVFFQMLQDTYGKVTRQQIEALNSYKPLLQQPFQSVSAGALVYLSSKHTTLDVPTTSTPEETYQSMGREQLAQHFEQATAHRAYWWLLPEVDQSEMGMFSFENQGQVIQVVGEEITGYEKNTLIGLQVGDCLYGVDYAGYYNERGNSTYPAIDIYQLEVLDVI